MSENGKALAVRGQGAMSPAHADWMALREQVKFAYESGMLPKAIDTPAKAMTIALMGRELGLQPMASLTGLYVVNGMAALRGSLMLRLIYERVPGAQVTILTPADRHHLECEVEMCRPGGKAQPFKFTLEDARKAGFMSKPIWQQHTATMMRWAAIRTGARIVFADALAGCYMEDEVPEKATTKDAPPDDVVVPIRAVEVEQGEPRDREPTPPTLPPPPPEQPQFEAAPESQAAEQVDVHHSAFPSTEQRSGGTRLTPKQIGALLGPIARAADWPETKVRQWVQAKYSVELVPGALDYKCTQEVFNFLKDQAAKRRAQHEQNGPHHAQRPE